MERSIERATPPPDLVLENLGWVRALARRLVVDVSEADDLVQEAWLAARGRTPREVGPRGVRPWLGGLLRNVARSRRRDESGRAARQSRAAREDRAPRGEEPDALLDRSERLAEVARAVLDLPEPFRRTMLLRWFEGHAPEEVARIEGVRAATVRTRIHRGRAQLREALDRREGGSSTGWALALVPYAAVGGSQVEAEVVGAWKAVAVTAGLVAVTAASLWYASRGGAGDGANDRSARLTTPSRTTTLDPPPALRIDPLSDADGRTRQVADASDVEGGAAAVAMEGATGQEAPGPAAGVLGGVLTLGDGTPVGGEILAVVRPGGDQPAEFTSTDAQGRFSVTGLTGGPFRVETTADRFAATSDRPLVPGVDDYRLEIDALMLRIRARDRSGGTVPVKGLAMEAFQGGDRIRTSSLSSKVSFESMDRLVPTTGDYTFAGTAEDGRSFAATVHASPPSRLVEVDLVEDAPEFGRILASITHPSIPDGARLRLSSMEAGGDWRMRTIEPATAVDGRAELMIHALLPGTYDLGLTLEGSPFVGVADASVQVEVLAGVEERVVLEPFEGGALRVAVLGDRGEGEDLEYSVELRRAGEQEWIAPAFDVEEEERGPGAVAGSTAITEHLTTDTPLPTGDYIVRVVASGSRPRSERVRILVGAYTDLEVTLEPGDR